MSTAGGALAKAVEALAMPGNPRIVALSGIFYTGGVALWYPLFTIFLVSRGIGLLAIGAVFALGIAASMVAAPIGGILADRGSRKAVMVGARGLIVAGTVILALSALYTAYQLFVMITAYGVFSFGGNMGGGALRALLYETSPAGKKGVAMSSIYVLPSLVAIPMPFIGSLIGESIGWGVVFAMASICMAASFIVYQLWLDEPAKDHDKPLQHMTKQGLGVGQRIGLLAPVIALVAIYSVVFFGQGAYGPYLPIYFTRFLGASVQFYGVLASIDLAIVGVLALGSGLLVDRIGPLRAAALSFAGEAVVVGAMVSVRNILLAGMLYVTWGSVDVFDITAPSVFVGSVVEKEGRATAIGMFGVVTKVPSVAAPSVGGILYGIYPPLILVMYGIIVASAAIATWAVQSHVNSRLGSGREKGKTQATE